MLTSSKPTSSPRPRSERSEGPWTDGETTFMEEHSLKETLHDRKRLLVVETRVDYLALICPDRNSDELQMQAQAQYEEFRFRSDDPDGKWIPASFQGETMKIQQAALEGGQSRIRQQDVEIGLHRKMVDKARESICELFDELEAARVWMEGFGKEGEEQESVIKKMKEALELTREDNRNLKAEERRLKRIIGGLEKRLMLKPDQLMRLKTKGLEGERREKSIIEQAAKPVVEERSEATDEEQLLEQRAPDRIQQIVVIEQSGKSPKENRIPERLAGLQIEEISIKSLGIGQRIESPHEEHIPGRLTAEQPKKIGVVQNVGNLCKDDLAFEKPANERLIEVEVVQQSDTVLEEEPVLDRIAANQTEKVAIEIEEHVMKLSHEITGKLAAEEAIVEQAERSEEVAQVKKNVVDAVVVLGKPGAGDTIPKTAPTNSETAEGRCTGENVEPVGLDADDAKG